MRIGLIAPAWLPIPAPAYGGTETVVDTLARGLHAAGHEVLLVCHPDSTCPVPRASVVPAADTVRMGRAAIELEHAIGAYELVKDCDVVHDHTLAGPVLRRPLPRPAGGRHQPHAVHPHDDGDLRCRRRRTVALVAISHSHAASTTLPIAGVVHHGVDLADFPVGTGERWLRRRCSSRMTPEKGVHRAIAIAQAAGVPLRIAAKMREPHEREYFDEFVEPHLGDDVVYLGELGAAEKRELLADAVALFEPDLRGPNRSAWRWSRRWPAARRWWDARRARRPRSWTHGVTGFLERQRRGLIAALRMVDRIDRAACRRRVADHFSVERMVEGYVDVYLNRPRRPSPPRS